MKAPYPYWGSTRIDSRDGYFSSRPKLIWFEPTTVLIASFMDGSGNSLRRLRPPNKRRNCQVCHATSVLCGVWIISQGSRLAVDRQMRSDGSRRHVDTPLQSGSALFRRAPRSRCRAPDFKPLARTLSSRRHAMHARARSDARFLIEPGPGLGRI
jgi:hypothetical protein